MTFETANARMVTLGQSHVLSDYLELDNQKQQELLGQIEKIDWRVLRHFPPKTGGHTQGSYQPLGAVTVEEIAQKRDEYEKIGVTALRQQRVGAVLLAGGQGTRLGQEVPKGTVDIGETRTLYIFECLFKTLLGVAQKAGAWVPLYIMTSVKNHDQTVEFLLEKGFFGYNPFFVQFFIQDMAPAVDQNGHVLMEGPGSIFLSPNGNGGWYTSMQRSGMVKHARDRGVTHLNVFAVDNVLQSIADPVFIGATLAAGVDCGAKVVRKNTPDERIGVLCLENGRPAIVEYYEMTPDMQNCHTPDGRLAYAFGVILNYLFDMEKLSDITAELPMHLVKKKVPHYRQGRMIIPETENAWKFESLVVDMVAHMDRVLPFEVVREQEFAPIKNQTGIDSIESARALLRAQGVAL